MSKKHVHPDFQLNGKSYKPVALRDLAFNFIKTGEPYEEEVGHFIIDWLNTLLQFHIIVFCA